MCSPAEPRLELPAMTCSSRLRLALASSSIGWRADSAAFRPSIADWVLERRSRSSAACVSCAWPPVCRRVLSSATSRAWPSVRLTRPQTSAATTPTPATRHTRSSANNSSSTDILRIVAPEKGIDKTVNMTLMAEIKPLPDAEPAPDRIPLEEVYMRMAEELAKRSTCARLQVGTVIATPDLTQVLGIGYNGNARGLPNRCDSTTPGACGCFVGGSKVMTDHGPVRIEAIKVGDKVLTHRDRLRPVTQLFRHQHTGPLVQIFLETRSVNLERRKTATPEHPFLVRRGGEVAWVKAGDLVLGDEVATLARSCQSCGIAIPNYRRMCPKCAVESSKSVESRRRHSLRMTERNPMRGIHIYDPSRAAISQSIAHKDSTRKVYQELVGIKRQFEAQGFRAIVVDHTVKPDLILIGDGVVLGV